MSERSRSRVNRQKDFLLDTHVLYYLDANPEKLIPAKVLGALRLADRQVFISTVTPWEMSIKHHLGKWPEVKNLLDDYANTLIAYGFLELPLQTEAALLAGQLPSLHRDPFDRVLISQAIIHQLALVSSDPLIHGYMTPLPELQVLWN